MPSATDDAKLAEDELRAEEVYDSLVRPPPASRGRGEICRRCHQVGRLRDRRRRLRRDRPSPDPPSWGATLVDENRAVRSVSNPGAWSDPGMTDRGEVNARLEAIIPLRVRGPAGEDLE